VLEKSYRSKLKRNRTLQAVLSVIPVVIILLAVRAYPMFTVIYKSFTNWDGMFKSDWVGLDNYVRVFTNSPFWMLLRNNALILLSVPLQIIIGLIVAVLLYEEVPGWRFFRSVYYVPQIMSAVIIGYLFRVAFGLEGPVNNVLNSLGLGFLSHEWLGNTTSALFVLVLCLTWFSIGWQAIVILGGMSAIPPSVFEASKIDGATFLQRTFFIVVPMIARTLEYGVIMSVVWTLTSIFPFIYSLTGGGPGYETTTLDYMIYIKSFQSSSNLGFACTFAVILMIIILAFTITEIRFTNKVSDWE